MVRCPVSRSWGEWDEGTLLLVRKPCLVHPFVNLGWFCFVLICFCLLCQMPGSLPRSSSQALWLPPFLSERVLLLHATLPGWYHSHNSLACPSRQGTPATLSPQPWSRGAQHYLTPGILSLPIPSPQLLVSDAAGNNFEANAQRRQWRRISSACTKFHTTKWGPFATGLLPVPQCWMLKENKEVKMAFRVFHSV